MVGTEIIGLTLEQAYDELKSIDNKIDLKNTLIKINENPIRTTKLKEIITSGGKVNNDPFLNLVIGNDENTIELRKLYIAKIAYEKYILDEIDRMELSQPTIVIVFLKDYLKWDWQEIAKKLYEYYSDRQIRNFYYDYKEKIRSINILNKQENEENVLVK